MGRPGEEGMEKTAGRRAPAREEIRQAVADQEQEARAKLRDVATVAG